MTEFKPNIHYCRDLEVSVLGICLIEPEAIFKIKSILTVDMFYHGEYQLVYAGLIEMVNQAIPIDLITASDYFVRNIKIPHIQNYETAYYLCRLTNHVVTSSHLIHWAKVIKAMWTSRELARVNPGSIKDLQATTRRLSTTQAQSKTKIYRFLLQFVDKSLLKPTLPKYGARIIAGSSTHKIKVSSPLLVYLMSICEPQYTWTCGESFHEQITNEQCKNRLPKDSLLTSAGWIDKTHKFPVSWR